MNQMSYQLADLKSCLEDLESAIQMPMNERFTIERILDRFSPVLMGFSAVLRDALVADGAMVEHDHELFSEANLRGWLTGDLSLWLRLNDNARQIYESHVQGPQALSIAQDVRACSAMMWRSYELLTARFRLQTQVHPQSSMTSRPPPDSSFPRSA